MLRLIPCFLLIALAFSCKKEEAVLAERTEAEIAALCQTSSEFAAPSSLSVGFLAELEFPGHIRTFNFVSDDVGFALGNLSNGSYSAVLRTDNGGLTWEDTGLAGEQRAYSFDFYDENFGIVSTNSKAQSVLRQRRLLPLVWITRDGGDTWEKHFINDRELDGRAGTVVFDSHGVAYLAISQESGTIIMVKSEDQGLTWSKFLELTNLPGRIQIVNDEFYFGPADDRIIRTNLSGTILGAITVPASNNLRSAEILDENNAYIITDSLYRTVDGGRSWKGIAKGRGKILGFNTPERGLVVMNVDYCPTDVGPSIDVLRSITGGDRAESGPQVASMRSSISAAHVFIDGTALIGYRNQIFRLE